MVSSDIFWNTLNNRNIYVYIIKSCLKLWANKTSADKFSSPLTYEQKPPITPWKYATSNKLSGLCHDSLVSCVFYRNSVVAKELCCRYPYKTKGISDISFNVFLLHASASPLSFRRTVALSECLDGVKEHCYPVMSYTNYVTRVCRFR